ncbi:BCCT family transporter [Lentisphaerota bacterium WC36G]|nr:BCCT family transporter [Lentisphaerae bacterium WC36]
MKKRFLNVNARVFFPSVFLITMLVTVASFFTYQPENNKTTNATVETATKKVVEIDYFTKYMEKIQNFIGSELGWLYLMASAFFLIFILWVMFSKHGKIKLGADHDEPEYNRFTWFSMLFSAGMGIGLLFYGVAEPIGMFAEPPSKAVTPETGEAALEAMRYTFFHWGFHAWAIYLVVGLSLAYFSYRHKLPLTLRSCLYPILGDKIKGFWGDVVEILAVMGTLFGVATSLGYGVSQVNTGLNHLNIIDKSTTNQIILIVGITVVATISVVSGVNKGVRRLSELNIILALALLLFVFFVGPTTFIMKSFSESFGHYMQTIVSTTFQTDIHENNQFGITVFYLAWWIAWSPFVGMFIARVSRGRTIREFIGCVLVVPVLLTFVWMSVFGNSAIFMELHGAGGIVEAVLKDKTTALFIMFEQMPFAKISCTLAIFVIIFFFITSSDSASLVIDIITSGGKHNPPVWQKIFWASAEGAVAIVLLLTGGLAAFQSVLIITAFPFCIVMLVMCYSLTKGLLADSALKESCKELQTQHIMLNKNAIAMPSNQFVETPISESLHLDDHDYLSGSGILDHISELQDKNNEEIHWQERLEKLENNNVECFADQFRDVADHKISEADSKLQSFIMQKVKPAFATIKKELAKYDKTVKIYESRHHVSIVVMNEDIEEFYYGIKGHAYHKFDYSFPALDFKDSDMKCYAQAVLRSGKKKVYDLDKFSLESIIHDFINEYEKRALFT